MRRYNPATSALIVCLAGLFVGASALAGPTDSPDPDGTRLIFAVDNNPDKPTFGSPAQQNGRTWETAFDTIQQGITAAENAGGAQVWVADGVYDESRGVEWGSPEVQGSLVLARDNVELYGGFTGYNDTNYIGNEDELEQRAPTVARTIIDGSESRGGTNAYHVIAIGKETGKVSGIVVDGFDITGGDASSGDPGYHFNRGGGIFIYASDPIIRNCTIYDNQAKVSGGGMAIEYNPIDEIAANPDIYNCVFYNNTALRQEDNDTNPIRGGGAIFITGDTDNDEDGTITIDDATRPLIAHCTFNGNIWDNTGYTSFGAESTDVFSWMSSPVVTHSIFYDGQTGVARVVNDGIIDEPEEWDGGASLSHTNIRGGYSCPGFTVVSDPTPDIFSALSCGDSINGGDPIFGGTPPEFPLDDTSGPDDSGAFDEGIDITGEVPGVAIDIQGVARPQSSAPDYGAYEGDGNLTAPTAGIRESSIGEFLTNYVAEDFTFNNDDGDLGSLTPRIFWDVDNDDSTEEYDVINPTHNYDTDAAGDYTVTLWLSNALGTASDTVDLTLREPVTADPAVAEDDAGDEITETLANYEDGPITLRANVPVPPATETPRGGYPGYTYQWQFNTVDDPGDSGWTDLEFRDGTTLADGDQTTTVPGRNPEIPEEDPGWNEVDITFNVAGSESPEMTIDLPVAGVHNGYYRCVVFDSEYNNVGLDGGTAATDPVQVNIENGLVIVREPLGSEFYAGNDEVLDTVVIGANGPDGNNYNYQWEYRGVAESDGNFYSQGIATGKNNPYQFTASADLAELSDPDHPSVGWKAGTGSPGEYRVKVDTSGSADRSDWVAVDVQEEVVASIDTPTEDLTKNVTETLTITASTEGGYPDPDYTYEWRWDGNLLTDGDPHPSGSGAVISGATTDTLEVADLEEDDEGDYTVTAYDSKGPSCPEHNEKCTSDATAPVTITNFILVQQEPESQKVYQGDTLDFLVEGGGGEPSYTFGWVWDFAEPFDDDSDGDKFSLSDGVPHPLTNSGVTITNTSTTSTLELSDVITGDPADTGGYYCVISDGAGNFNEETSISESAILEVFPPISIDEHPESVDRYEGQTAVFSVVASGGIDDDRSYQWQVDDGSGFVDLSNGSGVSGADTEVLTLSPLALSQDGNQYRCEVTGVDSAVSTDAENFNQTSDAAALEVSEPLVILDQPQDVVVYSSDPPFTLHAHFEGGKPFTSSSPIYETEWFRTGIDPDLPRTFVDDGDLETGAPNTAALDVDPNATGVGLFDFEVEIEDQVEVTGSDPARVEIAQYPSFTQPLENREVNEKSDFDWSVEVSGGVEPLTFQWQKLTDDGTSLVWVDVPEDAQHDGTTTATLSVEDVTFGDAGTYRVVVNDSLTAEITSEAELVVTSAVPVAGGLGLAVIAALSALGGAAALRRKRD